MADSLEALSGEERHLLKKVRRELRLWRVTRWFSVAGAFALFCLGVLATNEAITDADVGRALKLAAAIPMMAGAWLLFYIVANWDLPRDRLLSRLADVVSRQ